MIHTLDAATINDSKPTRARSPRFVPRPPESLADLGTPPAVIEQLIFKLLYFRGEMMGAELSRAMGFRFSLIEEMINGFKFQQLIMAKSSLGYGPASTVLTLTEQGRNVARDYLNNNQYVGPAPVSVAEYSAAVQEQKLPSNWLTPERLTKAYAHMVLSQKVLDQIGPAVGAGKSFLIFGQPGNGKTQLAESLVNIQTSAIWVPYALEFQGNIIQLFDPIYHTLTEVQPHSNGDELDYDRRWARCRRPFITSGGELTLSMLDLSQNPASKVFDAPFHMKANNGIYLIDDFGRQKASPTEILNRWIVPMERRIDYLTFSTGGKMVVPFETFLIFASNLKPEHLGDEAFLRRIQYKMLLASPDREEFRRIFFNYCESQSLDAPADLVDRFIDRHYVKNKKVFRRCQPRDIVSQAIDYIYFKRLPYELTDEILDMAFASCFVPEQELTDS